jgi:hypothetical protein
VRPQPFPNRYLRLGRLAADMRHAAVALGRCQNIGHGIRTITYSKLYHLQTQPVILEYL